MNFLRGPLAGLMLLALTADAASDAAEAFKYPPCPYAGCTKTITEWREWRDERARPACVSCAKPCNAVYRCSDKHTCTVKICAKCYERARIHDYISTGNEMPHRARTLRPLISDEWDHDRASAELFEAAEAIAPTISEEWDHDSAWIELFGATKAAETTAANTQTVQTDAETPGAPRKCDGCVKKREKADKYVKYMTATLDIDAKTIADMLSRYGEEPCPKCKRTSWDRRRLRRRLAAAERR